MVDERVLQAAPDNAFVLEFLRRLIDFENLVVGEYQSSGLGAGKVGLLDQGITVGGYASGSEVERIDIQVFSIREAPILVGSSGHRRARVGFE